MLRILPSLAAWVLATLLAGLLIAAPSHSTLPLAVVPVALGAMGRGRFAPWGIAGLLITAVVIGPLTSGGSDAEVSRREALVTIAALATVAACLDAAARSDASGATTALATGGSAARITKPAQRSGAQLPSPEAFLDELLELSRSLTTEATREEILPKVCGAVRSVIDGSAAVVLLRSGEWLDVVCHSGFGAHGPALERIPFPRSFGATAMTMGRTTSVDDIDRSSDTGIVDGGDGPPFRAVLSSPVRLRGRSMGVVEVYVREPRSFGRGEIAVIESLAAQVSISLHNAELADTIRYEKRRFETAFQTAPVGLAIIEKDGAEQIRMNPTAIAMLGLDPARELRLTPFSAARDEGVRGPELRSLAAWHVPLARALHGERIGGEVQSLDVPSRGNVSFLTSAAPILDDQQHVEGAIAAFADITEMNRLALELDARRRQAETDSARKSRFLAALSHDIRTPANAIGLLAELLDDVPFGGETNQRVQRLARSLKNSAHSLVSLVGDVLDYARFESGAVEVEIAEIALAPLLAEACEPPRAVAREKGLAFSVDDRAVRGLTLRTDRAKLARILTNLTSNAVKFTRAGSVEVVARRLADGGIAIAVRDTGVGLAAEDLALIFEEFTQVKNVHRDPGAGAGLGLTIAARIATMLGGSIGVESELGDGSTFTLTLPASSVASPVAEFDRPAGASDSPEGAERSLSGLRVLLVEDHEASREALANLLVSEGAELVPVGDLRGAVEALAAGDFHALILDLMLPDGDGLDLLERLRRNRVPTLRTVLVATGDVTPRRLARLGLREPERLVPKPVDFERLLGWLRPIAAAVRSSSPTGPGSGS